MNAKRQTNINERCRKLAAMGFEIHHQDSRVTHSAAPGINFDFSATAEEHFTSVALKTVFDEAKKVGANKLRLSLTSLLMTEQ